VATYSEDGKWMWTGDEWIPAPPTETPAFALQPGRTEVTSDSNPRRMKIFAYSASALIILTGMLFLFGFIGESIEGKWYLSDDSNDYLEFNSDGNVYSGGQGETVGQWSVNDDYLYVNNEILRYEIDKNWLFISSQGSRSCTALSSEPVDLDSYVSAVGEYKDRPDWCVNLDMPAVQGTDSSATTLNSYTADDAADDASPASEGADTLIKMQMTGKDDLAWSFVKITLDVGDNIYTCSVTAGDDCVITQAAGSNDNAWENGEYIFLSEGTAEICSAQGCDVGISVTNGGHTVAGDSSQMVN